MCGQPAGRPAHSTDAQATFSAHQNWRPALEGADLCGQSGRREAASYAISAGKAALAGAGPDSIARAGRWSDVGPESWPHNDRAHFRRPRRAPTNSQTLIRLGRRRATFFCAPGARSPAPVPSRPMEVARGAIEAPPADRVRHSIICRLDGAGASWPAGEARDLRTTAIESGPGRERAASWGSISIIRLVAQFRASPRLGRARVRVRVRVKARVRVKVKVRIRVRSAVEAAARASEEVGRLRIDLNQVAGGERISR